MSTTSTVCTDAITSTCNDAITASHGYEYVSVQEAAQMFEKSRRRLYAMAAEGLLHEVGFDVLRTKKGRIWIGIPRYGFSKLALTDTTARGGP